MTHPASVPGHFHVRRVEASDTGRSTFDFVGVNRLHGFQRTLTPIEMVPHPRPLRWNHRRFRIFGVLRRPCRGCGGKCTVRGSSESSLSRSPLFFTHQAT